MHWKPVESQRSKNDDMSFFRTSLSKYSGVPSEKQEIMSSICSGRWNRKLSSN